MRPTGVDDVTLQGVVFGEVACGKTTPWPSHPNFTSAMGAHPHPVHGAPKPVMPLSRIALTPGTCPFGNTSFLNFDVFPLTVTWVVKVPVGPVVEVSTVQPVGGVSPWNHVSLTAEIVVGAGRVTV